MYDCQQGFFFQTKRQNRIGLGSAGEEPFWINGNAGQEKSAVAGNAIRKKKSSLALKSKSLAGKVKNRDYFSFFFPSLRLFFPTRRKKKKNRT